MKCHPVNVIVLVNVCQHMKLKVLFLLNCDPSKYIAKLFSIGIFCMSGTDLGQLTQQTQALFCMCEPSVGLSSITASSPLMAFKADLTYKLA